MKKVLLILALGVTLVGCCNKSEGQNSAVSAKEAPKNMPKASKHAIKVTKDNKGNGKRCCCYY